MAIRSRRVSGRAISRNPGLLDHLPPGAGAGVLRPCHAAARRLTQPSVVAAAPHIHTMGGRVRRARALAEAEARAARAAATATCCALCERPLGQRTEWHHRVPKSHGGTQTVPVHPICHRTIHACVANRDLATTFADLAVLRAREDVGRFLRWLADKPADFHAPTRRPGAR